MTPAVKGKLDSKDERVARLFNWIPWISFFLVSLSLPIPFLVLYLTAASTESAAIFLLLSLTSLAGGLVVGGLITISLLFYRRRWFSQLRDKLAADGITAAEVSWFAAELTSAEREVLAEIQRTNPLLADAYCETLASRLTATRIITRAQTELVKVERRINRAHSIVGADTTSLLQDLGSDRKQLEQLKSETTARLAEAKARLQVIEAAASRALGREETDSMLRRLSAAQEHLPLAIEIARLEHQAKKEADFQPDSGASRVDLRE